MKKFYLASYLFLSLVLITSLGIVFYQSGLEFYASRKLIGLEKKSANLLTLKSNLETQMAEDLSLTKIKTTASAQGYVAITTPMVVNQATDQLAAITP